MDDVVLNKAATIERCIQRVGEVYAGDPANLTSDIIRQDSIVLNLQRACEAAIGLAMHLVRKHRLGIPQDSRDAFELLLTSGRLEERMAENLKGMVGFRNVAVHDYTRLNLDIVRAIVEERAQDLLVFSATMLREEG
ncbi:MAG: type VII toxin-antitoxin system HepT family RNase toxin [Pseudomonadales bacterium]